MKAHIRLEPTKKKIGDETFYIYPFPAFKAANITGDLAAVVTPLIGSLAPIFLADSKDGGESVLDKDIDKAAPAIAGAFNSVSGDKIEGLLKKLLTKYQNISVEIDDPEDGEEPVVWLTDEIADNLFCGNTQDMFVLAFHVIRVNFAGFFEKVAGRSGRVVDQLMKRMTSQNTANLI